MCPLLSPIDDIIIHFKHHGHTILSKEDYTKVEKDNQLATKGFVTNTVLPIRSFVNFVLSYMSYMMFQMWLMFIRLRQKQAATPQYDQHPVDNVK